MSTQRNVCEWCGERLYPGDRVVESVSEATVDPTTSAVILEGAPYVYHEREWTTSSGANATAGRSKTSGQTRPRDPYGAGSSDFSAHAAQRPTTSCSSVI